MSSPVKMYESRRSSIIDVIGKYVSLTKRGLEFWGVCPFHKDKHPSLSVNLEKGLFLCRSCGVGGDVITFIEKIECVDFKGAIKLLGLETYRPSPQQVGLKREAQQIAAWARNVSNRLCSALREIGDQIRVCSLMHKEPEVDKVLLAEHEASLVRQWAILCDLDDDLNKPSTLVELYGQRAGIENLIDTFR